MIFGGLEEKRLEQLCLPGLGDEMRREEGRVKKIGIVGEKASQFLNGIENAIPLKRT